MSRRGHSHIRTAIIIVSCYCAFVSTAGTAEAHGKRAKPQIRQAAPLRQYESYLRSLDASDARSVSKALDRYRKRVAKQSRGVRDAAYFAFRRFWETAAECQDDAIDRCFGAAPGWTDDAHATARMKSIPGFEAGGFRVRGDGEGGWVIDAQPAFFPTHFGRCTSPAISSYLRLERRELARICAQDGGLLIGFKEVATRLAAWEDYLVRFPRSPLRVSAKIQYQWYLDVLEVGLDNTPAFSFETARLLPEVQRVYEDYLKARSRMSSGKSLAAYYKAVRENGFRRLKHSHE